MAPPYPVVLFDMDGVLLDSFEANGGTAQIILDRFGLPVLPDHPLRKFIGPPLEQSFGKWYDWKDPQELSQVLTAFRSLYEERRFLCRVYPGVYDLLDRLRAAGVRTGLATMKRHPYVDELMEHFGFTGRLDLVQGRNPSKGIETKADVIRTALSELGVTDPSQAVFVGDSDTDLAGAQANGLSFVAVYYGFGFSHEEGDGADPAQCVAGADSVSDLSRFLLGLH